MALPKHPLGPPMTLGNMRHVGKAVPEDQRNEKSRTPRSLVGLFSRCLEVDRYEEDLGVVSYFCRDYLGAGH
jgi:hypothetical protein